MRSELCGRTPGIPLSALGVEQAKALASRLPRPEILISSPLQRALETARIVGDRHDLTPVISAAFTEFDFGEWTGRSIESLHHEPLWKEFNSARETTRAPGGESMAEVLARSVAAVDDLASVYPGVSTIAIVSHGDVIRSLLLHAVQASLNSYWRFTVDPASISELEWFSATSARIVRANA
jgi:broad specificity phosphatase PhoE